MISFVNFTYLFFIILQFSIALSCINGVVDCPGAQRSYTFVLIHMTAEDGFSFTTPSCTHPNIYSDWWRGYGTYIQPLVVGTYQLKYYQSQYYITPGFGVGCYTPDAFKTLVAFVRQELDLSPTTIPTFLMNGKQAAMSADDSNCDKAYGFHSFDEFNQPYIAINSPQYFGNSGCTGGPNVLKTLSHEVSEMITNPTFSDASCVYGCLENADLCNQYTGSGAFTNDQNPLPTVHIGGTTTFKCETARGYFGVSYSYLQGKKQYNNTISSLPRQVTYQVLPFTDAIWNNFEASPDYQVYVEPTVSPTPVILVTPTPPPQSVSPPPANSMCVLLPASFAAYAVVLLGFLTW